MLRFPPAYDRSVRWALVCQVIGYLLACLMLDLGEFLVRFLFLSLGFWVLLGIFMCLRRHPTIVERACVGSGPMLIFWTAAFVG